MEMFLNILYIKYKSISWAEYPVILLSINLSLVWYTLDILLFKHTAGKSFLFTVAAQV